MTVRKTAIKLLAGLAVAAIAAAAVWLGWLDGPDGTVSDALYQRNRPTDGEIIVIGMDNRAVDMLGPMPWSRHVMAEAIEYLNSNPMSRPAVIGIDVLYTGDSADPDADAHLAEAAAEGGNVVTASSATFGSSLVTQGDSFYMDTRAVLAWDGAYPDLADVTSTGHINAMADSDGVIRHGLLYIEPETPGERVYSFSRVIYELWCEAHGTEPNPLPPTVDNGFFYIPFTAAPGSYYESISVADLLNGDVDPETFAGKIVLIGPYAAGMQDEYRTSIDHAAPMYGIEIQANLIDAFRAGFLPKDAPDFPQIIFLFILCAAVFVFFFDRSVRWAAPVWIVISLGWAGICALLYRQGIVLHVLWPPLFVTALFIVTMVLNYVRAQRERRRVTDTFGRYVDPAIIKELLETGGDALELGGKMREIAVLFVDIRGFTTMSESLDPPTVVEIINSYLTLTTECIMRYHGTLDKFVGDCTMAFWNAPLPQEDAVYLACRAAMDMVEGSRSLGQELQERYGRTVSFGVGVNVGPAVVGNIGAPRRMDYTAIGDTVNTASRLESNAPGGTIYISRAVADALGDRARVTSLGGSIKLKGKAEGFEVLTLDSLDT